MTISIFCRTLGSQYPINAPADCSSSSTSTSTPVASRSTQAILFTPPAIDAPVADIPRYSKRKRSEVTYSEIDEDDFLLPSDAEEVYEPKAKVCHEEKICSTFTKDRQKPKKSSKPFPKHKIFPFMYVVLHCCCVEILISAGICRLSYETESMGLLCLTKMATFTLPARRRDTVELQNDAHSQTVFLNLHGDIAGIADIKAMATMTRKTRLRE